MKKLLAFTSILIVILCSRTVNAQTTLSFTANSQTAPEVRQYGRGAEEWHWDMVDIPVQGARTPPKNIYQRSFYTWARLEPTQDNYDFSLMEQHIRSCIDNKQKFSFGIMTVYQGDGTNASPTAGGFPMSYPLYLHNLMQAEAANSRDWVGGGWWIPNYNSPNYLTRLDSLHSKLNQWLNNNSYRGVKYKDVIFYIDIRGFGNWGEWHHYDYLADAINGWPTGRTPTYQSLKRIVQSHTTYFPDVWQVALMSIFDCNYLGNTWNPPAIAVYILDTAQTQKGKIGWRRDNWGATDGYIAGTLEDNNRATIGGQPISFHIMNRYLYAPIVGEPSSAGDFYPTPLGSYGDLENQVRRYGATSFGNGNYYGTVTTTIANNFRNASRAAGYNVILTGGSMTTNLTVGGSFNVTLNWRNRGISPPYDSWKIRYQLRNSSNQTVATYNSAFRLFDLKPSATATTVNENFTVPANIPAGSYRLHVIVQDSVNYMDPFYIDIQGRQSDGSYILRTGINITSTGNLPPVANAGVDQSITLPTNSVTLNGSGTDADGTIANYQWIRVLGTGGTIVSPTSPSTQVSGLSAGSHTFRLIVTDNQGATATDDVVITVNSTAPANNPPTSNAGANVVIQLPTSSVTLNGSGTDTDGTISAYAWTKVSGPAGGTIASPSAASTNITGLNAGVYVYRLTVTDNLGATGTDDVQITVTAANVAPTANAGADRTITLPTNSLTLTGSGTDTDGTITAYLWTKVSGPSGGAIGSPNAASTGITGLLQGTYVYRLRVTDNQGATATDDVSIIVNPAPQPEPPGNWIFTQTPTPVEDAGAAVVLGVKFRASQSGAITKLRFWKTPNNTGTHTWAIYSESGTRLDSGRFEVETASGWQYDDVDTLFISANTTYVVAYYSPTGFYAKTENSLNTTFTNNVMSAPSTFTSGGNGVYIYNAGIAFPNLTYQGNNYWVDVMYENIQPPVTPNVGPVVNAGFDAVVLAPNTQYQLNGTATDSDGTIDSVSWSLLSASTLTGNPVTVTISDSTILDPVVGGLSEPGTYTFLLQAWDDDGASSTDLIVITVRTASTNYLRKRVYIFNGRNVRFR